MNRTRVIGNGSYGIVYQIGDRKVLKRNLIDLGVSFIGSLRELDICMSLRGHPSIVTLLSVTRSCDKYIKNTRVKIDPDLKNDNLHFIFEQAIGDTLQCMIKKPFTLKEIRRYICDLLLGLEFMHSRDIIHRDIKTQNLLLFGDSEDERSLKICDFGLSKPFVRGCPNTPRMITSWYRSPDACLGSDQYGPDVDIWSCGCVLYEFITRHALCEDAKNESAEDLVGSVIGRIPKRCFENASQNYIASINKLCNNGVMGLSDKDFIEHLRVMGASDLVNDMISLNVINDFLSFVSGLLHVDPLNRFTTKQALDHSFLKPEHNKMSSVRLMDIHRDVISVANTIVTVVDMSDRNVVSGIIKEVRQRKSEFSWYSDRIIFQSISLFDRYLQCVVNGKMKRIDPINAFMLCTYSSVKYFLQLSEILDFNTFSADGMLSYDLAEDFEYTLVVEALDCRMYQPTLYEYMGVIGRINEDHVSIMLDRYLSVDVFKGTLEQLYNKLS